MLAYDSPMVLEFPTINLENNMTFNSQIRTEHDIKTKIGGGRGGTKYKTRLMIQENGFYNAST